MNKGFIALVLALTTGCAPVNESGFLKAEHESPVVVEHYVINGVYENHVEATGYVYYTVYAVNESTGRTECIADDLAVEYADDWLITIGQRVRLVYAKGKPFYSGELYPVPTGGF